MLVGVVWGPEEAWVRRGVQACGVCSFNLPPWFRSTGVGWTHSILGAAPDCFTGQGYMLERGSPSF